MILFSFLFLRDCSIHRIHHSTHTCILLPTRFKARICIISSTLWKRFTQYCRNARHFLVAKGQGRLSALEEDLHGKCHPAKVRTMVVSNITRLPPLKLSLPFVFGQTWEITCFEKEPPFSTCIPYRDLSEGRSISSNVISPEESLSNKLKSFIAAFSPLKSQVATMIILGQKVGLWLSFWSVSFKHCQVNSYKQPEVEHLFFYAGHLSKSCVQLPSFKKKYLLVRNLVKSPSDSSDTPKRNDAVPKKKKMESLIPLWMAFSNAIQN